MPNAVFVTQDGPLAVITLNRPLQMNALNHQMIACLEDVIGKVKNNPVIRVVVIRAAGEAFMAGSDLYEVYQGIDSAIAETPHLVRQFNSATLALREMEKPVLAVVHGLVTGMGMSLMLAADLVVASDTTHFSLGYCNVGTSPVGGLSYNLPRIIGNKKAMELLLLSEIFDAKTAASLGLINWVVSNNELTDFTKKIVDKLMSGPTLAFSQTKQLLNSSSQHKLSIQMEFEAESFNKTINSRDFKAAVCAFINKRQPEFEGR